MSFCLADSQKAPKEVNVELGVEAQVGGHQTAGITQTGGKAFQAKGTPRTKVQCHEKDCHNWVNGEKFSTSCSDSSLTKSII